MSYANQSQTNITVGLQYQGLLERLMFSILTSVPCCVFLFINGTMLFTLRSKTVFRESSRYILLYNLLLADTVLMALGLLLFILATLRIRLTYPVCGFLTMLAHLTYEVSPLTLVVMSLERYVAVCYPLRHATIITIRNTAVAIIAIWAFSSLNVLTRVVLLLDFPFEDLESLQMKDICSEMAMLLGALSAHYDKAYTCFLFISAGVTITSSYVGVMVAARLASTNEASAHKARKTLLLHLVQLSLSLSSVMVNPLLTAISEIVSRLIVMYIYCVVYVFIILFPRCLSALIYGLRDQNFRPVLMYHLSCVAKQSNFIKILSR
ncbi:hypothetical protein PAMP_006565 [Pampus punctatissimus]